MKKYTALLIIILLLALMVHAPLAEAQKQLANPVTDISYKYYPLATNRTFVASQGDSAICQNLRIGGCTRASYTIKLSDTATVYINIDYRTLGESAWNTSHRDTITYAPADSAAITYTYPLRSASVNYIDAGGIDVQTRIRLIFAASGQSVIGTNKYWLTLNWKD
ncbi:MAG: hypothetical protein A3K04_08145 [Gallionellales bacterium RBG_16_56_9]|nr:MAG: hypothetical protein A3K04_08145 [Gallionellales bacterium RBG_16_56_9]